MPNWVPDNFVPVSCAHGAIMAHQAWDQVSENYDDWLKHSFKKVVCRLSDDQWNWAHFNFDSHNKVVVTESALGGIEVAMAVHPEYLYDPQVKKFKLWSPS